MIPVYVGIDPGKGGGIAAVDSDGVVVSCCRMPETDQDILAVLHHIDFQLAQGACFAALERVHAGAFGGGRKMGATSAFTFGQGYGGLRMALAATCIPYDDVMPRKWQQDMGCLSKGDKNVTKRRAQALFPHQKVTHATADALLLAEYCRRSHRGAGTKPGAVSASKGASLPPVNAGPPFPPVQLQDGTSPEWTCPECGKDALYCGHARHTP